MSSTPHDASSNPAQPTGGPTVDEEPDEHAEPEDLEEQLDLVATRSPI
jgi:hypothetical protein